jgi:hypothetical protein
MRRTLSLDDELLERPEPTQATSIRVAVRIARACDLPDRGVMRQRLA